MTKNIEYVFHDGENSATVDRASAMIRMDERGGWGRSYSLTFKELFKEAKKWDIKISLKDSDEVIAGIATNIILANNAEEHGVDPFRYVPRTNKITSPKDKDILKNFEALLKNYTIEQVLAGMSQKTKANFKLALIKNE